MRGHGKQRNRRRMPAATERPDPERSDADTAISVEVCRICFATDCRLYAMTEHTALGHAYQNLTGLLVEGDEALPACVCVACARRLRAAGRLRARCLRAHLALLQLANRRGCITLESIKSLVENQSELDSELSMTPMKTDYFDLVIQHVETESPRAGEGVIAESDDVIEDSVHIEIEHNGAVNKEEDVDVDTADNNMPYLQFSSSLTGEIKIEQNDLPKDSVNDEDVIQDETALSDLVVDENNCIPNEEELRDVVDEQTAPSHDAIEVNFDEIKKENDSHDGDSDRVDNVSLSTIDKDTVSSLTGGDDDEMIFDVRLSPGFLDGVSGGEIKIEKIDPLKDEDEIKAENSDSSDAALINGADSRPVVKRRVRVERGGGRTKPHSERLGFSEKLSCEICPYHTINKALFFSHLKAHAARTRHSCDSCHYITPNRGRLAAHALTHGGDYRYICDVCNKPFRIKSLLIQHMRKHSTDQPYSCNFCVKSFGLRQSLVLHLRTHSGERPYICDVCGRPFAERSSLRKHLVTHSTEKPYICDVCGKSYNRKGTLTVHVRAHFGDKPHRCEVCNNTYSWRNSLLDHMKVHRDGELTCNAKTLSVKSKPKRHNKVRSNNKRFSCIICKKAFSDRTTLKNHMKTHSGEKPHTCDLCKKSFTRKSTLRDHLRTVHEERPADKLCYTCDICKKVLSGKRSLRQHSRTHTGEKPYACTFCDRSFCDNGSLRKHKMIHTGEKPYACHLCTKAFNRMDTLTNHIKLHSKEKLYSCDICDKTFARKNSYIKHLKSHDDPLY